MLYPQATGYHPLIPVIPCLVCKISTCAITLPPYDNKRIGRRLVPASSWYSPGSLPRYPGLHIPKRRDNNGACRPIDQSIDVLGFSHGLQSRPTPLRPICMTVALQSYVYHPQGGSRSLRGLVRLSGPFRYGSYPAFIDLSIGPGACTVLVESGSRAFTGTLVGLINLVGLVYRVRAPCRQSQTNGIGRTRTVNLEVMSPLL